MELTKHAHKIAIALPQTQNIAIVQDTGAIGLFVCKMASSVTYIAIRKISSFHFRFPSHNNRFSRYTVICV